jgi:pimeloyl-ACP methyl ester carboxylesterase
MRRGGVLAAVISALMLFAATSAGAVPILDWKHCAKHAQCATAELPRNYSDPSKGTVKIALTRIPATNPEKRIGSLFFDFGGPGFGTVEAIRDFGRQEYRKLNRRYDLVAFDPRGVGLSRPAINCHMNGERESKPLPTPATPAQDLVRGSKRLIRRCLNFDRRKHIIPYVSTENVVRDLDQLRAAVGDTRLNYLGYSYGTTIGGTYATLYPDRVGRLVLDGPVDLWEDANRPLKGWLNQAIGAQDVLDGFLRACKRHQDACSNFGDGHPARALAALHRRMSRHPIPAGDQRADGDDLLAAIDWDVYGRQYWNELAVALHDAERGDGKLVRQLADFWWGYLPDGSLDPGVDANLIITAIDQAWPHSVRPYLKTVRRAYRASKYLWWIGGTTSGIYANVVDGLFPVRANTVFRGPFENSAFAPTALVVATTHDPATPYEGAKAEVRQLGNARLLTMKGYTHTAYPGASGCIDHAVEAYLMRGVLPARGTTCRQHVPFERYQQSKAKSSKDEAELLLRRASVLPLP